MCRFQWKDPRPQIDEEPWSLLRGPNAWDATPFQSTKPSPPDCIDIALIYGQKIAARRCSSHHGSNPWKHPGNLPLKLGLSTTPVLTMMSMRLWLQLASKASPWTAKPQLSIRRSACPGWYADTLLIVTEKDRSLSAKTQIPIPRFHDVQKKQQLTNARLLGVKIVGRASLFSENHKAKDDFIIPKYSRILSGPITSAGCLTPEYPRLPG